MSGAPLNEHGLPDGYPLNEGWEITPREVAARLKAEPDAVLLDCREPDECAIASVEGAKTIPMGEIPARLPELLEHADVPVFVMCHHGRRSMQVTAFLREQGFDDVKSVAGGIDLWSRAVDPSVPRY